MSNNDIKELFEKAIQKPVKIETPSKEEFILMSIQNYINIMDELETLRSQNLSLSEIIQGKTTKYVLGSRVSKKDDNSKN